MAAIPQTPPLTSRTDLLGALSAILPRDALLSAPEDLKPYECDGLSAFRQVPLAVVLAENEGQESPEIVAIKSSDIGGRL